MNAFIVARRGLPPAGSIFDGTADVVSSSLCAARVAWGVIWGMDGGSEPRDLCRLGRVHGTSHGELRRRSRVRRGIGRRRGGVVSRRVDGAVHRPAGPTRAVRPDPRFTIYDVRFTPHSPLSTRDSPVPTLYSPSDVPGWSWSSSGSLKQLWDQRCAFRGSGTSWSGWLTSSMK